jgi:hypothetical protein
MPQVRPGLVLPFDQDLKEIRIGNPSTSIHWCKINGKVYLNISVLLEIPDAIAHEETFSTDDPGEDKLYIKFKENDRSNAGGKNLVNSLEVEIPDEAARESIMLKLNISSDAPKIKWGL